MKTLRPIYSILLLPLLLGCSNLIQGTQDTIFVNSLEQDTTIFVDGVPRGKNQATAQIKRGKPHTIKVTKKGCQDIVIQTGEKFDMTSLLGCCIDAGMISIPIDLITGAAWKTEPTLYTVTPICEND